MNKTALFLATFTTLASLSYGKEVSIAPITIIETQEIIVDKFKPNGNADLSYTYYGQDEHNSKDYGRLQFLGEINMTEKQNIEWRIREYRAFQNQDNKYDGERKISDHGDFSDMRFRYHYNTGFLGNSKINLTHRLEYRTYTGNKDGQILYDSDSNPVNSLVAKDSQYIDYTARLEFKDYISNYTPDWFKNTSFVLAPRYRYGWASNDSDYYNRLGLNMYSNFDMPYGFSFEFNLYGYYQDYGQDKSTYTKNGIKNGTTSDLWALEMEAYLYWTHLLWSNSNWKLSANFEGGYDPYTFNSERTSNQGSKNSYELYAEPSLKADYAITDSMSVYGMVHAKYFNWDYQNQSNARDWVWQPRVTLGIKTTF